MESYKSFHNRRTEVVVHGELFSRPIRRRPQGPQLGGNESALLRLVLPDAFEKLLSPHLFSGGPLFRQSLLHHELCGNACVVGSWQPQDGSTPHAMEARQDILQGHKHGVAHVQAARDIGRGHGEYVGLFVVVGVLGVRSKATRGLPPLVHVGLEESGLVLVEHGTLLVENIVGRSGRLGGSGGGHPASADARGRCGEEQWHGTTGRRSAGEGCGAADKGRRLPSRVKGHDSPVQGRQTRPGRHHGSSRAADGYYATTARTELTRHVTRGHVMVVLVQLIELPRDQIQVYQ